MSWSHCVRSSAGPSTDVHCARRVTAELPQLDARGGAALNPSWSRIPARLKLTAINLDCPDPWRLAA